MQVPQNDGIQEFVVECKSRLHKILERLEWTEEGVLKNFNSNSVASAPKEVSTKLDSLPRPKTYPNSLITDNSIVISTPKLQTVLQDVTVEAPQNFDHLQGNFSREQKLKIYEYAIENTKKLDNNTIDEVPEGEVSLADIVAERKREAKRKKRKFRKTKPTRIEEVRALVQLQMQALQQFVENRDGKQVAIKTEKDDNVRKPNESWDFSHRKEAEQNHNTRSKHEERYQYKHRSTTKDNNKYNQEISFSKTHRKPEKCQENKDRTRNVDPYSSKYKSSEDYTSNKATEKGYRRNSRSPRRSNQSLKFEKEYDKRIRKHSRSPAHSRSISKKHKDYTKYRETDIGESNSKKHKDYTKYRETKKDYKDRSRKRSRSSESDKYSEFYKSDQKLAKHRRNRNSSREDEFRKQHSDRYENSHSSNKRDKDNYSQKCLSPRSHRRK